MKKLLLTLLLTFSVSLSAVAGGKLIINPSFTGRYVPSSFSFANVTTSGYLATKNCSVINDDGLSVIECSGVNPRAIGSEAISADVFLDGFQAKATTVNAIKAEGADPLTSQPSAFGYQKSRFRSVVCNLQPSKAVVDANDNQTLTLIFNCKRGVL